MKHTIMGAVEVTCDFGISTKCQKTFTISQTNYYANRKRNNGQIKCKSCALVNGNLRLRKDDRFFSSIGELQAYMLGIIAGDGNLNGNTIRVVAQYQDIETLKLFQENVSPFSKIVKYKSSNCWYISFTSRQIADDVKALLSLTDGNKSRLISIPDFSDDLKWHYIRGLMDTDGSIADMKSWKCTYPICSYASMSSLVKRQIMDLCDDVCIPYTKDKVSIKWNGRGCMLFLNLVYNNYSYALSRKLALYKEAKLWIPGCGNPFKENVS